MSTIWSQLGGDVIEHEREGLSDFDFAVSFADEDRDYVENLVERLKAAGLRVFYDRDHAADMWGEDLVEYFDQIYRVRAQFAMLFVSRSYAIKMWTRHERRSALARAIAHSQSYLLPIRLDDTVLDGLRPTLGYLDARQVGVDGIVTAALQKLEGRQVRPRPQVSRVPRTEFERQMILLERPEGWEYLLFAGQLLHGKELLEPKYRDHELGYADSTGTALADEEVVGYLLRSMDQVSRLARALDHVMSADVQERAFGGPGEAGDAERIVHLAMRWNSVYEAFLDWSARLRGLSTPSEFSDAVALLARFGDGPIDQYRAFVDECVREIDLVPHALATGTPLRIELTLTLRIPDGVSKAFSAELRRLPRR